MKCHVMRAESPSFRAEGLAHDAHLRDCVLQVILCEHTLAGVERFDDRRRIGVLGDGDQLHLGRIAARRAARCGQLGTHDLETTRDGHEPVRSTPAAVSARATGSTGRPMTLSTGPQIAATKRRPSPCTA